MSRLAQKVVEANGLKPLAIYILYSVKAKALAPSGRFIFLSSGVLSAADSKPEFAAAIAHEIAHLGACRTSLPSRKPGCSGAFGKPA